MVVVMYMMLAGLFVVIGNSAFMKNRPLMANPYKFLGFVGVFSILFSMTFTDIWYEVSAHVPISMLTERPEMLVSLVLLLLTGGIFAGSRLTNPKIEPLELASGIFALLWVFSHHLGIFPVFAFNIMCFGYGIYCVLQGVERVSLGRLNWGLMLIAILVTCRFFDTDLSFVIRGLLFITVGVGFFVANYLLINKKKNLTMADQQ